MSEHETKIRRGPRYRTPEKAANQTDAFGGGSVENDLEASLAGVALNQACGGTTNIAWSSGVGEREARRYKAGGAGNPLHRAARIIERAKEPFAVVGFFAARACKAMLTADPMPEWRWRSLYLEAMRAEAHPDGAEDCVTADLLTGKASIQAQYDADAAHVAALLKRMALGMIGILRGWKLEGPRVERAH